MYSVTSCRSIDAPWTAINPIRVGPVPPGQGTPHAFVEVERDGEPFVRVDVYVEWEGYFQEVLAWEPFVVVGCGDAVHLVEPAERTIRTIACDGYFGSLHPVGDRLLIASASELICLDRSGEEAWRRPGLGVDGVLVDRVADGLIYGRGEWDPPDGWLWFSLRLDTGEVG